MKKNHLTGLLITMCVFSLLLSGCNKETEGMVTLRGYAGLFSNGKVFIDINIPRWNVGDQVMINGSTYGITNDNLRNGVASWEVSLPAGSIYSAVYPADMVTSMSGTTVNMTIPSQQYYHVDANNHQIVNAPMGVCTDQTRLEFKNMGSLLAISIVNNSSRNIVIDKVIVKSVGDRNGNNPIALWGDAIVENFSSNASNYYYRITDAPSATNSVVELIGDNTTNNSMNLELAASTGNKVVYVYVPAVANQVENRFNITVEGHASGNEPVVVEREQSSSNPLSGTIPLNHMASVTFNMQAMVYPDHTVEGGLFSVSATHQVFFSNGNLQYHPRNHEWCFAEHQYDICGGSNNNPASQNTYIDLFGWGTSGQSIPEDYEDPANEAGALFMDPTSTSTRRTTGYNVPGYGPSYGNGHNGNLYGDSRFFDWGCNMSGNNIEWRTLTYTEYYYLLLTRIVNGGQGEGYAYTYVTINSHPGMLIYPDGFTMQSEYNNATNLTEVPASCAFLPCAGSRLTVTYYNYGTYDGDFAYWTASTAENDSELLNYNGTTYAEALVYNNNGALILNTKKRQQGLAVRLVTDYTPNH